MTNQRAVSDSFRIGRDDIYTCLYLFFNQSGRIPVVHANRCINMYYNRLYHPSRNINHLFRKSVNRYSARFTLFLSAREVASIGQSVKCYFEDLAVVYFFNYHYRTTDSFRREIFRWIDPSEKISLSRISLERDFRMKAG